MKALLAFTASFVLLALAVALTFSQRPDRPSRPTTPVDAGPPPAPDSGQFAGVAFARSRVLQFELRGSDFEDARGRGCPLEAIVDEPDAGDMPTLRFRCAAYGGP
jgi:hypothetical protein